MDFDLQTLISNPDLLWQKLEALSSENQRIRLENKNLRQTIDVQGADLAEARAEVQRLTLELEKLRRRQFGPKSERLDPEQFELALEGLEQDLAAAQAKLDAAASRAERRAANQAPEP